MNKIQPKTQQQRFKERKLDLFIKQYTKIDYMIFYLLVPTLLLLIYFLPYSIKQYLILDVSNPTLISIFFSNYTHSEFQHLFSNLVIYLILIFLLFRIETDKKMFYKVSLVNFMLLPFVVSLLTIHLIPKLPPVQGFSAIVSGFDGYLLYSVFKYVKNKYYKNLSYDFLWILLMLNFVIWSISNKKIISFIALAIITIILIYNNKEMLMKILSQMKLDYVKIEKQKFIIGLYEIFLFLLILFFIFSLYILIPQYVIIGTVIINTPSHYFGYLIGLFSPILITFLEEHS